MIILSVLALAVMAEGYRLVNQSSSSVRNDMFSLMCEQNGVNDSILEIASANHLECTEVNFGMKTFEREFTEAQYKDSYNELFKKYCAKIPQLKVCYQTLMDAVSPCVGNASELLISTTKNIMNQILDFLCEDDGAIMSRFSTEGGPQCLQGKTNEIIACAVNFLKATTYKDINMTASEASNNRIYQDSLSCVLQNLETCNNSISSKVFKKIADTIHQSVSKLVLKLSKNFTTKPVLDPLNGTQNVSDRSDDDMSNKLQNLCEKNGVSFKDVQAIVVQSVACMKDSFGIKMLDRDLEEAQNSDSYAKIFKRYCPKAPLLKTCIHTLIYGVSLCFGDDAEDYRTTTKTAYDGAIDYACQHDGFRMAKFFVEGGPQCLKNISHDFKTCAENSKKSFLQGREIALSVTQIHDMANQLMNCILKSAASCEPAAVKTLVSIAEIIRNTHFHETKKKLPEKTTRSLIKASGTVVLDFNFDIFV
ncbi:unnamed protein product [Arctia plantaginis]|uniref:Uncharacterized protein n=1 Tax=Arctia plantaginis TaxID=874455 RepID=A0A8S1A9B6_ARCPL|nr:unnamed protein product [Arctia plantaginis]